MLKKAAVSFGMIFLLCGVVGAIYLMTPDHRLFGIFGTTVIHSILYILTGLMALFSGMTSTKAAHIFFQLSGILYVIFGVLGFGFGDQHILGFIPNNSVYAWFHLLVGIIGLYLGFGINPRLKKSHRK